MTSAIIVRADNAEATRAFLDMVFASSPEKRAQRAEEGARFAAELKAKHRREILEIRENICRRYSPEREAEAREEWALQDRVRGELEFTMEQQRRRA